MPGNAREIDFDASPSRKSHFGGGDGEPAFGDIVGRENQARRPGLMEFAVGDEVFRTVGLRHQGTLETNDPTVNRSPHFITGQAEQTQNGVAFAQRRSGHVQLLIDNANAAAQEGHRNIDRPVLGFEVVVKRVLPGNEGRFEFLRRRRNSFDTFDQATQFIGVVGIAHAEVVEQGDFVGVGSTNDQRTHGFVHAGPPHRTGIGFAPFRQQRKADGHGLVRSIDGNHRAILRRVTGGSRERFEQCIALNFVVVFADDRLAGTDREVAENHPQFLRRIRILDRQSGPCRNAGKT